MEENRPECNHSWVWLWEGPIWTDYRQCINCNKVEMCKQPPGLKAKLEVEDGREEWRKTGPDEH